MTSDPTDSSPDGPLFTTNPTGRGFAIWMSHAPRRDLPDMESSLDVNHGERERVNA